ncbi:MAG: hypothetical protein WKF74_12600 [Pyrinomonadaceae bacterium]
MAEATQIAFKFRELAEILLKHQGIREGHWSIYTKFAINAANVSLNGSDHFPTALVPVIEMGLQRESDTEPGPLAVNAAEVNSAPKTAKKGASKKATK